MDEQNKDLTELTAHIVGAYVAKNPVPLGNVGELIESVSATWCAGRWSQACNGRTEPGSQPETSVKQDHIVCLECGKKLKSLKRHLGTEHGLAPDEYRSKWNLGANYPMVAPDYSAARSELARTMGLGRKPGAKVAKRSRSRKG